MRPTISRFALAVITATTLASTAQPIWADDNFDLDNVNRVIADLADELRPSTVAIHAYDTPPTEGVRIRTRPDSQGSGVIYKSSGYILTNYHVIGDAPDIRVTLHNGKEHQAAVLQIDRRADLAVLKIDANKLRAAPFANDREIRVGHIAIAIGNPFGVANFSGKTSFSWGGVSTIGRNLSSELDGTDTRYYGELIETWATINPGNSGGPLFNIHGEIMGIVTAIETTSGVSEGLGFAIPINDRTQRIIDTLTRGEEVRYGYLGVSISRRQSRREYRVRGRDVRGARIGNIVDGSPAADSVLELGDIVVEFDGVPIDDPDQFVRVVGSTQVGQSVLCRFVRHSNIQTTTIRLGDRFDHLDRTEKQLASMGLESMNWRGAELFEINAALRREFEIPDNTKGLRVDEVRVGSDANMKRLTTGQIITAINGRAIRSIDEFRRQLLAKRIVLTMHDGAKVAFDAD